jgi:hypothetical protein
MPEGTPTRVAVRFPTFVSAAWRERCLASLRAAGNVEVIPLGAIETADLVVDLSTEPPDAQQLGTTRLGYWTFVYGNEPEHIEPCLTEFVGGARAAYVRLVQINRPNSATVLREGSVKVVRHSLKATRQRLLAAVVEWPGQQLRAALRQARVDALPTITLKRRGTAARMLLRATLPLAWIRNILTRVRQEVTREHWAVGVIPAPVQEVYRSFDPSRIRWLPPPADGFLADPFGLARPDGTLVIMAEALSWQDGRGRIVALAVRGSTGGLTRRVLRYRPVEPPGQTSHSRPEQLPARD